MQILKEEVKNKILEAALEEFLVNGYENSSLRTIAAQAGITIGNIYSYFSSKDELFECVVKPAWEGLSSLIFLDMLEYQDKDSENLVEITQKVCKVFIDNRERFLILINGSSGSKFENVKQNVADLIASRIKNELFSKSGKNPDPLIADALSTSLLEGFLFIFNHYGGDDKKLFKLINELIYIFLGNITSRL